MIKIILIIGAIIVAGWILKKVGKFLLGAIIIAILAIVIFVGAAGFCGMVELPGEDGSPPLEEISPTISKAKNTIENTVDWLDTKAKSLKK